MTTRKALDGKQIGRAVFAALAALGAFADDDPYANYVKLSASDTDTKYSWNVAGNWDDGLPPSSDKNYYVPAGKLFFHPHSKTDVNNDPANIWDGGQLVIGGTFNAYVSAANDWGMYIDDLVLLGGSLVKISGYGPFNKYGTEYSDVTVLATTNNPAMMYHTHKTGFQTDGTRRKNGLYARFLGTPDSGIIYYRGTTNDTGAAIDRGWACYAGNYTFAKYPGQLTIRGEHVIFNASGSNMAYNWPDTALKIEQGAECSIFTGESKKTSNANAYFRAFDIGTGGAVSFYYSSSTIFPLINVTERFCMDGSAKITIGNLAPTAGYVNGVSATDPGKMTNMKFAHLTGAAATTVGDLPQTTNVVFANGSHRLPKLRYKFAAVDNGDGTKDVWLTTPDVVTMKTKNGDYHGAFEDGQDACWSNNETPPADSSLNYWLKKRLCVYEPVTRTNATLTIASEVYWKGGVAMKFKEVNHYSGVESVLLQWNADRTRSFTAEKWNLIPAGGNPATESAHMGVKGRVNFTLDADIYGDTGLIIRNDNNGEGSITLSHMNTNFHGRLTVCQDPYTNGTTTINRFNTNLADARNWGGAFTASDDIFDAITITNFPKVTVTGDVDFTEPTRGMYIKMGVTFAVNSGKTLRLSNQVTYAGVIEKTGAGTLDLAGTARFIDGAEETAPAEDTNVVRVAEGSLRISSSTAADGLALVFEEGTRLVIPSGLEGGYRNTKWDMPLTINTTSGKLPVDIDIDADDVENGDVEVTLFTFNATAADGISAGDFVVGGMSGGLRAKKLEKRTVDGGVAFVATVGRVGSRFIVR